MTTHRTGRGTYVYCVVEGAAEPSTVAAPPGLAGLSGLRALAAGPGLWLIAASAPARRYGEAAIAQGLRDLEWAAARALEHERVVVHFRRRGNVLPLRLLTLFSSDARALQGIVRMRSRVRRLLRRIRGCSEWSVRLSVDPGQLRASAERVMGARGRGAGTRFLVRKSRQRLAQQQVAAKSGEDAARAFRDLARVAHEARRRAVPATARTPVVLDAVFLVEEARVARFRAAARGLSRRLGLRGYDVVLTGPWPPYHFAAGGR